MGITFASGIITPEVPNNKEQPMYHIIKDNGDRIYVSNGISKINNGISKITNGSSKTKLAIVIAITIAIIAIISLI